MRFAALVVAALVPALGFAACSSTTETQPGGTSSGTGAGPAASLCPSSAPGDGSACVTNVDCEYGTDIRLECNTVATCDGATWHLTAPAATGCPTPANGAGCPPQQSGIEPGAACTDESLGCTYTTGSCACEVYCGSQYPVGHECEAGTPTIWVCTAAPGGCAADRPTLGTACTQEDLQCNYGDCNAIEYLCKGGLWRMQQSSCPISARRFKRDVHYLEQGEIAAVAERTLRTRLATYRYVSGDPAPHLGFIIDDDPSSPAVIAEKERVDLYAYASMAVATLQVQEREIADLRRDLDSVRAELAALRAARADPRRPRR